MRKTIAILLSLIMILAALPLSVSANDTVYYLDGDGNFQSVTDYTLVTYNGNNIVTWSSGFYVVNENTSINGRVTVSGIVNLIILDGVTLSVSDGIELTEGNVLAVYGQGLSNGTLYVPAISNNNKAGIGSTSTTDDPVNCGSLVINGGNIVVERGGYWSASIGAGGGGNGGTVIINGGSVSVNTATSGVGYGAGIGGGYKGSGGTITINGGTVNASGANGAASIGGGGGGESGNPGLNASGNITINGGTVNVNNIQMGAGIGSGNVGKVNSIVINGGTVNANLDGYGSAIGLGYGDANGGSIEIHGGNVTATSKGPGIGGNNTGKIDSITITDGTVYAKGGGNCPGIGSANPDMVITISGGNVTAVGGDYGAGIGAGWASGNDGSGGIININGGVINATGGKYASAIGAGYANSCGTITFNGGQVTAVCGENGVGIGGYKGSGYRDGIINFNLQGDTDFVLGETYSSDHINFLHNHYIEGSQTLATADNITANKVVKNATVSTIKYIDENGNEQTHTGYNGIVASTAAQTWTSGWYAVTEDILLNKRVTVSGTVNLILCDGATLNAQKGITVDDGNTLNIYGQSGGTGTLTVDNCESYMAAIGSFCGSSTPRTNCGVITINGGVITAQGGYNGAGIGGGNGGTGGTIIINGGTVTATGGQSASGIGGGSSATSGNITINGGVVNATGSSQSAGIGAGSYRDADTIVINGGRINATAGSSSAAIGGGYYHGYNSIIINGGNITAEASDTNGTGIGKGYIPNDYTVVTQGDLVLNWTSYDDRITAVSLSSDNIVFSKHFYVENPYQTANASNSGGKTMIPYLAGDINVDGVVDILDIADIMSASSGNTNLNELKTVFGDFNFDGVVDGFDVAAVDRYVFA